MRSGKISDNGYLSIYRERDLVCQMCINDKNRPCGDDCPGMEIIEKNRCEICTGKVVLLEE